MGCSVRSAGQGRIDGHDRPGPRRGAGVRKVTAHAARSAAAVGIAVVAIAAGGCSDGEDADSGGAGASGGSAGQAGTGGGGAGGSAGSGASGGVGGSGGSDGSGGSSGGSGSGGGAGVGGGGSPGVECPALSAPTGSIVQVTAAQAGELPNIVFNAAAGTTFLLEDGTYTLASGLQLAKAGMVLRSASNDATRVI